MKVGIITQPLDHNYGGILQNYALQKVLKQFNIDSITFDYLPGKQSLFRYILSCVKTCLLLFTSRKRPFYKRNTENVYRKKIFDDFVEKNIVKTKIIRKYKSKWIGLNGIDALIVGSDQVWRPKYNYRLADVYLKFCKGVFVKRIAYAASFGVDYWEYSSKQTQECSKLVKKFDAISVREESGVKLCKENLNVDATWVLDPTLLLKKDDYLLICKDVPVCTEKYIAVYVLDENEQVAATCKNEAAKRGLIIKKFYADTKSILTVPEWLAMFRDASYVVTDSFHGTVFSIIFGKKFKCLYNKSRGSARFDSLLKLYESGKLDEMREFSMNWLKNALK